ncbi:MAG TPA: Gfo/Idh/MocA family oxidoreductase [Steroidobacteraceae bacterium]
MSVSAPVRLALIGGGPGSFIGPIHRMAAELDGRMRLVAGVFSRDADKSLRAAEAYGIPRERSYAGIDELLAGERARGAAGAELIAIATPNSTHLPIARAALEAGFDVISDKPVTATLDEAIALRGIVRKTGRRYGVTYTYSGYAMVREARELVRSGRLGTIRKIVAEYSQGWLARPVERDGNQQAAWRSDPAIAGAGGCIADIGVHAFHLAEFISGLRVTRMCADLAAVVPGRVLDDDCQILLRFANGARGVLLASQIAAGDRNGLRIRIWGEAGGLDWSQETPDRLVLNWIDAPTQVLHAGSSYLSEPARGVSRLPPGHPEGFIEALANLYRDYAVAIRVGTPLDHDRVPGIDAGVRGLGFVTGALAANGTGSWLQLDDMEGMT